MVMQDQITAKERVGDTLCRKIARWLRRLLLSTQ